MERMNPLDASFLYFEDGVTHMHIASCALFEGPPPDYRRVVDAIASKLPAGPPVPPSRALRTMGARPTGVGG